MVDLKVGTTVGGDALRSGAELEQMGYASLWVSEHILFYGPTLESVPQLGALTAITTKATLGTAIYLLPLRHPTIVAKSFGTLDILSHGRITLGIGVGGEYAKEFEATGVPVKQRGSRSDEAIDVIKRLWGGDHVSHHGRFFQFEDVSMQPKPARAGGPPIVGYWLGRPIASAIARANIMLFFAAADFFPVVSYAMTGLITSDAIRFSLLIGPVYAVGVLIGATLFGRASEALFRSICYALIAAAV